VSGQILAEIFKHLSSVRTGSKIDMTHRSDVRTWFDGAAVNCQQLHICQRWVLGSITGGCTFLFSPDKNFVYICQHYVFFRILTSVSGLSTSSSLALSTTPKAIPSGLELGQKDAEVFVEMLSRENRFMDAMRSFRKRGRTSTLEDDDE
jgi:hypothetical protein